MYLFTGVGELCLQSNCCRSFDSSHVYCKNGVCVSECYYCGQVDFFLKLYYICTYMLQYTFSVVVLLRAQIKALEYNYGTHHISLKFAEILVTE